MRLVAGLIVVTVGLFTVSCSSTTTTTELLSHTNEFYQSGSYLKIPLKDGIKIEGILYRPLHETKKSPGMVVLHGYNGSAQEVAYSAELLSYLGYSSLAVSMRGWGKSGGKDDCGLRQGDDLAEIAEWLGDQDGIDASRIGVLGYSQGAQVALLGAAKSQRIRSIVAYFPPTDLKKWGQNSNVKNVKNYVDEVCSDNFEARSPIYMAEKVKAPTLLVHGGRDGRVPTEQSILMQRAIKSSGGNAKLMLVPGARHSFNSENWKSSWATATSHLNSTLRTGKPSLARVRSISEIIPRSDEATEAFAASVEGYPLVGIFKGKNASTRVFYLEPSCAACGSSLLDVLSNRDKNSNVVFIMGAKRDSELGISAKLYCGGPNVVIRNLARYFDAMLRSDFSRGPLNERQLLSHYDLIAQRSVNTPKKLLAKCQRDPNFQTAVSTAKIAFEQYKLSPATVVNDADSHSFTIRPIKSNQQGGIGVGVTANAISASSVRGSSDVIKSHKDNWGVWFAGKSYEVGAALIDSGLSTGASVIGKGAGIVTGLMWTVTEVILENEDTVDNWGDTRQAAKNAKEGRVPLSGGPKGFMNDNVLQATIEQLDN